MARVCSRGVFSRIFQGRGLFSESPPRPSGGRNLRGLNLKDVEEKCGKRSDRPSRDPTTLLKERAKADRSEQGMRVIGAFAARQMRGCQRPYLLLPSSINSSAMFCRRVPAGTMAVMRSPDFLRALNQRDCACNIDPPALRHHAEGRPLPRRKQWAREG